VGHLLGYARVSTTDQNPDLQLDALNGAGCYRLFVDKASGALDERPELIKVSTSCGPATRSPFGSSTGWDVRCAT
jgi:DNA invertase Pin-like site-specific DNA recombinase